VVIRKRREQRKLSIEQLAARTGFFCKFLRAVEAARVDAFLWQLREIGDALGLTLGRLLAQAGQQVRRDADLLKLLKRLAAQEPTRRRAD
jgi:transcriptional regulator with XRE-family HTH domain